MNTSNYGTIAVKELVAQKNYFKRTYKYNTNKWRVMV